MSEVRQVTVDDIKQSLRIDVTDDNDMIQAYLDNAKRYIQDAVDPTALS